MRLYEIRLGRPYNSAARRENRRGIADKRWWKRRGGASQRVWVLASLRLHCLLLRFCPRSYEIQNCDRLILPSKCSIYVNYLHFLSNPTPNCPPPHHQMLNSFGFYEANQKDQSLFINSHVLGFSNLFVHVVFHKFSN